MTYDTTQINVNGAWREALIVSSDAPIEFPDPTVIRQTVGNEEWVYRTDGLFRAFEEDGKCMYWFLIRHRDVAPAYATKEEITTLQERISTQEEQQLAIMLGLAEAYEMMLGGAEA